DPQPFAREDHTGVAAIEFLQSIAQRAGAVGQQRLPTGIERFKIDCMIDFTDQIVLAWEIAIQQRLRNPQPTCQIARATSKSFLREKLGRLGDELLEAIIRRKPLLLVPRTLGRSI